MAQWQACNGVIEYGRRHALHLAAYWSIENGSRVVAKAIVTNLLIIRADRDNYYYGGDELYTRHPEGIQRLCADAAGPFLYDDQSWQEEEELLGFISKSAKADLPPDRCPDEDLGSLRC